MRGKVKNIAKQYMNSSEIQTENRKYNMTNVIAIVGCILIGGVMMIIIAYDYFSRRGQ